MGKYRGADGWLHDDSADKPKRYEHKENLSESAAPQEKPAPKLTRCPNCALGASWMRLEGYCRSCGWGKKEAKEEQAETTKLTDQEFGACCGWLTALMVLPLIGSGVGYANSGFGGLLVGVGIGIALPIAFLVWVGAIGSKKQSSS